jgi:hypothetical protein
MARRIERRPSMKKAEVQCGGFYVAAVRGQEAVVQVTRTAPTGGGDASNLRTRREIRVRTAQRLRRFATEGEVDRARAGFKHRKTGRAS